MTPRPITPGLRAALDDIERAFPDRRRGPIAGCPCCVRDHEATIVGLADRREIPLRLLGRFASDAMLTWGGADELRSLLPPILDAIARDELGIAPQIVAAKMPEVVARGSAEARAVDAFFAAWIDREAHGDGWLAADAVESAALAQTDLPPLLAILATADAPGSITELARQSIEPSWPFSPSVDPAFDAWLAGDAAHAVLARAIAMWPADPFADLWRAAARSERA